MSYFKPKEFYTSTNHQDFMDVIYRIVHDDIYSVENPLFMDRIGDKFSRSDDIKYTQSLRKMLQRTNKELTDNLANPIREMLGEPVFVTSGYRPPSYNKFKSGVKNSYHTNGLAFDFYVRKSNLEDVYNKILKRQDQYPIAECFYYRKLGFIHLAMGGTKEFEIIG